MEIINHLPLSFLLTFTGLFGLVLGSFANVLIWRIPRNESIVTPGSHCPHCNTLLHWYDNVPVLSFLWLRARCRFCKAPISWRYPIIEVCTMALAMWGVATWQGEPSHQLVALLLAPILVALAAVDAERMELPDSLVLSIGVLGIAGQFFASGWQGWPRAAAIAGLLLLFGLLWRWLFGPEPTAEEVAAQELSEPSIRERWIWGMGGFVVGLVLLVSGFIGTIIDQRWNGVCGILTGGGGLLALWGIFLFLRGSEAVGLGDVKLMAMMGIIVGARFILFGYVIGALLGMLVWLYLKLRHKIGSQYQFPFGPSLMAGAWIAWLYGNELLEVYLNLFL